MSAVDLNRIYHVQSREREPVLNGALRFHQPDAAGAFLAAGRPALQAQMGIARDRARERQGLEADRWRAIGQLARVGADVANAYAGALARKRRDEDDALDAAYRQHVHDTTMGGLNPDGSIRTGSFDAPYVADGDGNWHGAHKATLDGLAAFDESDAYKNASRDARERFKTRRARLDEAARDKALGIEMQQRMQKRVADRSAAEATASQTLSDLSALDDSKAFDNELAMQMPWRVERLDPESYAAAKETLERKVRDGAYLGRIDALIKRAQAQQDPEAMEEWVEQAAILAEGRPADEDGNGAVEPAFVPGSAEDTGARLAVKQAREMVERAYAAKDRDLDKDARDRAAALLADIDTVDVHASLTAYGQANGAAHQIKDPALREATLKKVDAAQGLVEFQRWDKKLQTALATLAAGDAASGMELLRTAEADIGSLFSASGKELAAQRLAVAGSAQGKRIAEMTADVLARGWYFDEQTGSRVEVDRDEMLDLFQANATLMDGATRDRVAKAFDANRPRLSAADFDALEGFLGANDAKVLFNWSKIGASESGAMVLAENAAWGDKDRIDINDGVWKRDIYADREMARKIWELCERWTALKSSGVVQRDAKGQFPTLDQYLDQTLKDDAGFRNWRANAMAERIDSTLRAFQRMEESMFFDTPPQD